MRTFPAVSALRASTLRGNLRFHELGMKLPVSVQTVLDAAAAVTMIAAGSAILWWLYQAPTVSQRPSTPSIPLPNDPVSLEGAPVEGSTAAKVGMLVFSDFECPYCRTFAQEILPSFRSKYVNTGLVKLAFRHLPLPNHPWAKPAAEFSGCAAEQGRFWTAHDKLFATSERDDAALLSLAASIGLDMNRYSDCLARIGTTVDSDRDLARRLGISGTPAFLLGKLQSDGSMKVVTIIRGTQPISAFASAIDPLLDQAAIPRLPPAVALRW